MALTWLVVIGFLFWLVLMLVLLCVLGMGRGYDVEVERRALFEEGNGDDAGEHSNRHERQLSHAD